MVQNDNYQKLFDRLKYKLEDKEFEKKASLIE